MKDHSDYKVFIASSLTLTKDRQDVEDAVLALNEGQLKDSGIQFSIFDYVKEEAIVQRLERGDAQDPIRRHLYESLAFILIIRGRIGNLSVSEYEDASQRFMEGRFPENIFIFYDEDHSRDEEKDDKGVSYPEFEENYLRKEQLDSAYRIIHHERGYYIPFGGKHPSLKEQVMTYLSRLVCSDDWHFPGSLRNFHLQKEDFYSDENRLDKCWKYIYFSRRFDSELDDAVANKQILYVEGASLSGKTRAVMQLLSSCDDGWIYILPGYGAINRMEAVSDEIEAFLSYLHNHKVHPLHYFFLDDVHELLEDEDNPSNGRLRKNLRLFLSLASQGAFKLIVTSTRPFSQTLGLFIDEDSNAVQSVFIPEMQKNEYKKAIAFFSGYGLLPYHHSFEYRTTGALLIDLDLIRSSYLDFLNQKKASLIRHAFLKSVKAASIWQRTNFGELGTLKSLTRYFLERNGVEDWNDSLFDMAVNALIDKPQCGITRMNPSKIIIQEYVCRELIGFDGNIKENNEDAVEKEKSLIRDLMEYCLHVNKTPLVQQVGKLGARSENSAEIGPWLMGVFSGDDKVEQAPWVDALRREKADHETDQEPEEDEYRYWYSLVFSNAVHYAPSFQDAQLIYNKAVPSLRAPILLTNLMRRAKTEEDWEQIRELDEYKRYVIREKEPFVLSRLMEFQKDFTTLMGYFHSVAESFSYHPAQVAEARLKRLDGISPSGEDRQILKDISIMEDSLDALGRSVRSEEDFEELMEQLRSYYCVRVTSHDVLEKIRRGTLDPRVRKKELTLLDLLSVLETSAFRLAVQGAFGVPPPFISTNKKALQTAESFVKNQLLPSFKPTLAGPFTDETTARRTASSCINALIESLGHLGFERVRDTIFKSARCPHPLKSGKQMILLDCYAYIYMLQADACSPVHARGLLDDYLIPHTQDPDNPLVLSTIQLNLVLEKVLKSKQTSYQDVLSKILPLYRQNHIRLDTRSYYLLIINARNEAEAVERIKLMLDDGVSPDLFTLCALAERVSDMKGALGLAYIPMEILPDGYETRDVLPEVVLSHPAIRLLREHLAASKKWWEQIFEKQCESETDRTILESALNYIKKNLPDVLEGSRVLNAIVGNDSFLTATNAVFDLIQEYEGDAFPDIYTFSKITKRVSKLKGKEKRRFLVAYNALTIKIFKKVPWEWAHIATMRANLFSNFDEVLGLVFKKEEENGEVSFSDEHLPLIGYLKKLSAEEIPNLPLLFNILENVSGYEEAEQQVLAIFPTMESYDWNRHLTERYLSGESNQRLNDVIRSLRWTDYSSAVLSFNRLIHQWSIDQRGNPSRFEFAWKLYQTWFKHGSPMPETYSALVSCCNSYEEVINDVYPAFDLAKQKYPQLVLDGFFLARLFRFGGCAADIRAYSEVFLQKGGIISSETIGTAMIQMLAFDDPDSAEVLTGVCKNLFGEEKTQLKRFGPPFSQLNPNKVSGKMLYAAFSYSLKNHLFSMEQIIDCLIRRYKNVLLNTPYDFLPLALKYGKGRNDRFIMLVLMRLLEVSQVPEIPSEILQSATLSLRNFGEYRLFIRALRKGRCLNIDDMVPAVVRLLFEQKVGWIRRPELEGTEEARGVFSRIVTYCKINRLRNGHLLPNKDEIDPNDRWCQRSMDCAKLKAIINPILGKRTIHEQIQSATQNLTDRYLATIRSIIYEKEDRSFKDDTWVLQKIKEFEDEYAVLISSGKISFRGMTSLASLWIKSNILPSAKIIAALYGAYSELAQNAEDEAVKEEAAFYHETMLNVYKEAKRKQFTYTKWYYSSLGKLNEQEAQKNYGVIISIAEFEKEYANLVGDGKISFDEMTSLSSLWIDANIFPNVRILIALYRAYGRLAKNAVDEAVRIEATNYWKSMYGSFWQFGHKKLGKVRFFYSGLGRLNDEEKQLNRFVLRGVAEFEEEYAYLIRNGMIPFEEMVSLVSFWLNTHIVPGVRILTALLMAYYDLADKAEDETVRNEAACYSRAMLEAFKVAQRNKWTTVQIYYSCLGRLNEIEKLKNIFVTHSVSEYEADYASLLARGEVPFREMASLASMWIKYHIVPNAIVLAGLYKGYQIVAKSAEDGTVRNEAEDHCASIRGTLSYAASQNYKQVRFYYRSFGKVMEEDCQKHLFVNSKRFNDYLKPKTEVMKDVDGVLPADDPEDS